MIALKDLEALRDDINAYGQGWAARIACTEDCDCTLEEVIVSCPGQGDHNEYRVLSWKDFQDLVARIGVRHIALLNTSILTDYGHFSYQARDLEYARGLIHTERLPWKSYIGHESTAQLLSGLLGVQVPMNRELYRQNVGERALVFKLKGRPPEGKIMSLEEIEAIGYEFGELVRFA